MVRACIFILISSCLAFGQNDGAINGFVQNASGQRIAGAIVSAVRVFPVDASGAQSVVTATTDANGVYTFLGVTPAIYRVCVAPGDNDLLDPCVWSDQPPICNVVEGQTAKLNISLTSGRFVHVRIDDPTGKLNAAEARNSSDIPVMMWTRSRSGVLQVFREAVKDKNSRTLRVLVAKDQDVSIITASSLEIDDAKGQPVQSDRPDPKKPGSPARGNLTTQAGKSDTTINLSVK